MASTYAKTSGLFLPSDCRLIMDNLAAVSRQAYPRMGINAPGESGTIASTAATARNNLLGDGTSLYGVANAAFLDEATFPLSTTATNLRADLYLGSLYRGIVNLLNKQVSTHLPSGWSFLVSGVMQNPFDAWLLRCNGFSGPANSVAPTNTITVTAATSSQGALPSVSSANAPRVFYTLVGDRDWKESLPNATGGFAALSGAQNAYTITLSGTPPTTTGKVRLYRTRFGEPTGEKFWVKDYPWTGGTWPTGMALLEPDNMLREDITPPVWAQCLAPDDFAALWAWSFGSLSSSTVADFYPLQIGALAQLTPGNIACGPAVDTNLSPKSLGGYNPASSVLYGLFNGSYSAGSIRTSNAPETRLQGFAGSVSNGGTGGIRARVTSALSASIPAANLSITYEYFAAATGWGVTQTQTGVNPTGTLSTAVGSIATFNVPAGRVVRAVTACTVSSAPTGEFVLEGTEVRTY